jgi:hypothetical protein
MLVTKCLLYITQIVKSQSILEGGTGIGLSHSFGYSLEITAIRRHYKFSRKDAKTQRKIEKP